MVTAGYYPHVTAPRRTHISVAKRLDVPNLLHFYIDLKAGDEKFVKVDYGAWAPTEELSEVSADVALPEIRNYRLIAKCE